MPVFYFWSHFLLIIEFFQLRKYLSSRSPLSIPIHVAEYLLNCLHLCILPTCPKGEFQRRGATGAASKIFVDRQILLFFCQTVAVPRWSNEEVDAICWNKVSLRSFFVQVAQLVRAKDWKSLCQWFESTSERAGRSTESEPTEGRNESLIGGAPGLTERTRWVVGFFPKSGGSRLPVPGGPPFVRVWFLVGWIQVETRCSAVWSAHLFWVQRAIGSNPVTLM
jgi:hypothetical protein